MLNIVMTIGLAFLVARAGWANADGADHRVPDSAVSSSAQNPHDTLHSEAPVELESVVVTATRSAQRNLDIPAAAYSLSGAGIRMERLARTLPDALADVPGAMVQKTAYGQTSPYLRGFTGFHTVMLVDGIRLNNSVFRSGPNQYWSTIDLYSTDAVEVIMGPGSVLYGTDAVGGVVNVLPRRPTAPAEGRRIRPRLQYRYASAEESHTGRLSFLAAPLNRLALTGGVTGKHFGDLQAGGAIGVQPKTAYGEWDADLRAEYTIGKNQQLVGAYQRVAQDDVWRTHKTLYGVSWEGTSVGSDRRYVLDQERQLGYVRYHAYDVGHRVKRLSGTLSLHRQVEDQDRMKKDGSFGLQGFRVHTLGLSIEGELAVLRARAAVGIDLYRDNVASWASNYSATGDLVKRLAQGPVADGSTYDTWDAFGQAEWPLGRYSLLTGVRFSHVAVEADRIQDPTDGHVYSLSRDWQHLAATVKLSWHASEWTRIYGGVSHAFRAPNLSDLTRFDIARSSEIEVPSPDLDPETFLCYEVGAKIRKNRWSGQLAVFYTSIRNLIIRVPTGEMMDENYVVTKKNASEGYVTGLEAQISALVGYGVTVVVGGAWVDGRADAYPTSSALLEEEPLDRLMPVTFECSAIWRSAARRTWAGAALITAARQDELSEADRQDTQRIPPGGTPGYTVVKLRAGTRIASSLTLSTVLDNVFDTEYRIHGSGQNEPGRNFVVSLSWE